MSLSENQPEEVVLSWEQIHQDCDALAEKLAGRTWRGIIAVTRGGLAPVALLSRALDNKMIETLCMASYDHQDRDKLTVLKTVENIGDGAGWLVVDDLADTGATFAAVREMLPRAHIACPYVKPAGAPQVDTYLRAYEEQVWLNFPWEMRAGFTQDRFETY
ncbi:MAG: xanthine phosphoribosyltransferase [Alphaproteobacteria bacterium]|nr:xanthine phosphoribosyltransferase [Alphaproteobacteria bacterium]